MVLNNENLYFYYISLSTEFIDFSIYKNELNDLFIAEDSQNATLLELEFSTESVKKTIGVLNNYLS